MTFFQELEALINRHSLESPSNTPDFILSQYLMACLATWNQYVGMREHWHGRSVHNVPSHSSLTSEEIPSET